MTQKIFVGYTCALADNAKDLMPDDIKDEDVHDWNAQAVYQPFTGRFSSVYLIAPGYKKTAHFLPEDGLTVEKQVVEFLNSCFKDAWPWDAHVGFDPQVFFVGFDPHRFLKMLGLNCTLPALNCPMPASLWYGNTNSIDIEEVCLGDLETQATFDTVLKAYQAQFNTKEAARFDKLTGGWTGPWLNAKQDAEIAAWLGAQLRLTY